MLNLVIQSTQDIATPHLKAIAKLVGAKSIEAITQQAFRLVDVTEDRAAVSAYCDEQQLDWAFVQAGMMLSDIGLVVMDMDSTLITIECIDEIADMLGIKPQVAEITERAMRGEMDFHESLRQRVGLLDGLEEEALDRVYKERLQLSQGAAETLAKLQASGAQTLLISGGFNYYTHRLQERLNLTHTIANTLEVIHGKLTGKVVGDIIDADAKITNLIHWREKLGLKPEQVMALGDGANDLKMLGEAGIGIAYHAKPIVRAQAKYSLTYVGWEGLLNWFAA